MSAEQKLFDLPAIPPTIYSTRKRSPMGEVLTMLQTGDTTYGRLEAFNSFKKGGKHINTIKEGKKLLGDLGL